jgi:hypothetical protein
LIILALFPYKLKSASSSSGNFKDTLSSTALRFDA